jgi:hypothetical protein
MIIKTDRPAGPGFLPYPGIKEGKEVVKEK